VLGAGYVLERELGRGGMATVWLAHDRKHERRVAVKVLHTELALALGAERFLREIRVIATLQHPHILGLIDSGVVGPDGGALAGRPYYVMPYVDGRSLRQRLDEEGQLPVAEAVRLTSEVASALDYAHRHGVIHRDIKPENILLNDGSALVADFGIALAVQQSGERMTETGLSLGTPQYMSPEQAAGERGITPRSDIYALGAVAYEMLTGEPPFTGPNVQAIVARVLATEPRPMTVLRPSVPPPVETAVLQALEKLPADRFASAAEFAAALQGQSISAARTRPVPGRPAARRAGPATWIPYALLPIVAVAAAIAGARMRSHATLSPQDLSLILPSTAALENDVNSLLALSPDGTILAYNGLDSTRQRRLYLRPLDRAAATPIAGSETAHFPAFSPDGRWVGFILNSRVVRVRVAGGAPETVCDVGGLAHWTWLDDGSVVFADATGLRRCSATQAAETLLPTDSASSFNFPHALPGGHAVLFTVQRGGERRLAVLNVKRRTVKALGIAGSDPRYAASGHLLYAGTDGNVLAVPFALRSLEARGDPVVVTSDVRIDGTGRALMAVSRSGVIVAAPAEIFHRTLELLDLTGRADRLYPRSAEFSDPRIAPDGQRIAVDIDGAIWQLDRSQGTLTRLSFNGAAERPAWSPDGRRVAYVRRIGSRTELWMVRADGGGRSERLLAAPALEPWHVLFTRDGRSMLIRTVDPVGKRDILLARVDSSARPGPLLATPANEVSPSLSPDGRWLAYASDESGRYEVYVRSFPDMSQRYQVSPDGGSEPVWSPRGGAIFYRAGPTMMMAAVREAPGFQVVRRTPLFSDDGYARGATYQNYDVTPDGTHLVMVRPLAGSGGLMVLLNRLEHLQAAAPQ
jgi:serine/threonine-protein kinase